MANLLHNYNGSDQRASRSGDRTRVSYCSVSLEVCTVYEVQKYRRSADCRYRSR